MSDYVKQWAPYWRSMNRKGFGMPDTYLVIDTETGGFHPRLQRVLSFGYCMVVEDQVVENSELILRHPPDENEAVRAIEINGLTWEVRKLRGVDPVEGLREIFGLMEDWRKAGGVFVAHNGEFDLRFLRAEFDQFLTEDFDIPDDALLDTGAFVKGAQIDMRPFDDESLRAYCRRVVDKPARGIYWKLDKYCFHNYKLGELGGITTGDLESQAHGAGFDCLMTHYLVQRIRQAMAANAPATTSEED